ncbi:MAG: hypothetical protein ACO3A4_13460 [Silvanigrellaceae bacterium]
MNFFESINLPINIFGELMKDPFLQFQRKVCGLAVLAIALAPTPGMAAEEHPPFSREISLLVGPAYGGGDGLQSESNTSFGFLYARSFNKPEPERFLLRVIADTLWTSLKTSEKSIAVLSPNTSTSAVLIRFGFSGCWLWSTAWMACLDDGPRISWLSQGSKNAHVLGSFPLGLSVHNADLHPWSFVVRAETGRWNSRQNGSDRNSDLSFVVMGAGFSW